MPESPVQVREKPEIPALAGLLAPADQDAYGWHGWPLVENEWMARMQSEGETTEGGW